MEGRCLTPGSPIEKLLMQVQGFSDEEVQRKGSARVTEAHVRGAKRGHVVGGRIFGYRNIDVFAGVDQHGRPLRSHVDRVIEDAEAAVVRHIFEL